LYLWARPSEARPEWGGRGRVGQRKRHRRTLGNRSASGCAGDRAPPRRGRGRDPQPGNGARPAGRLSLQLAAPTAGEDHRVAARHGKAGAPSEDSSSAAGFNGTVNPADARPGADPRRVDGHRRFRLVESGEQSCAPVSGRRQSAYDAFERWDRLHAADDDSEHSGYHGSDSDYSDPDDQRRAGRRAPEHRIAARPGART
jgi:hypothetical protein